jgi:hypothetical protein
MAGEGINNPKIRAEAKALIEELLPIIKRSNAYSTSRDKISAMALSFFLNELSQTPKKQTQQPETTLQSQELISTNVSPEINKETLALRINLLCVETQKNKEESKELKEKTKETKEKLKESKEISKELKEKLKESKLEREFLTSEASHRQEMNKALTALLNIGTNNP